MRKATLTRLLSTEQGTPGIIEVDTGFVCMSIELPYRDENLDGLSDKRFSCLPPGTYIFERWKSPTYGQCYKMVEDDEAPNRSYILIHAANVAGDTKKGFASQLMGCIAPGIKHVTFKKGTILSKTITLNEDQLGVSSSRTALKNLERALDLETFQLAIVQEDVCSQPLS